MVVSKKGQKLAESNLREKDFRSVQRGIKPGGNGWQGSFVGYKFISGERTDLGGGVSRIHGVTDDGHVVDLLGTTAGGKEEIVTRSVKQGPKYDGTLFMASDANVPVEVFRDTAAGAIFAQAYSKEVSNIYQGKMSKAEAVQVAHEFNRRIGINILGTGGVVGKTSSVSQKTTETSASDVITQAAMAINRSDMAIRQKEQAYQELTRMLIAVKRERPEDLPKATTMLHDGENPFGEIKNTEEGRLEKLKDTMMGDKKAAK